MEITISRSEDVRAVLADPRFVPPSPTDGPVGSMAWFRSAVARFSHGAEHARRRALVEAELAALDLAELRREAAKQGTDENVDTVAVAVLASALGVAPERIAAVTEAVGEVAAVYLVPGDEAAESAADEAVQVLLADLALFRFHSGHSDLKTSRSTEEAVVARVSLLVQAYVGTAGLIRGGKECGSVAEALRRRPPVTRTTRVATVDTAVAARGATVVLDLASAGLPFGGEPRVCPGRDHALAIAVGAVHGEEDGE
jgi:cytochrome P450